MNTDIKSLSTEEKIALAEELWRSIDNERDIFLTEEQKKLLEYRIKIHNENAGKGKPWREVKNGNYALNKTKAQ